MYTNIVNVNISLQTSAVSRTGFGTALFIGSGVWFTERVRTYTSLTQVAEDVPTTSNEYLAATKAFAPDVKPSQFKLGRRDVDEMEFTPEAATAIGQTYAITVVGTDDVAVEASFVTVTGSETASTIATALVASLAGVVGVTVTDNTGSFSLSKAGTDPYAVTLVDRLTFSATTTETASDTITAIRAEDDDWYFLATDDHTDAFVMSVAAQVESTQKQYFVALQDVTNLVAYSETGTDTIAKLAQNEYSRTAAWYHHEADTTFPELQYITLGSTFDAGKIAWGDNRVLGGSAAKNATTGIPLSATEKTNLVAKNANFTETVGGIVITRQGTTSSGNWIDEIRDRDFAVARTTESLQNLLINTPKLPYTDPGIAKVENTLAGTYSRMVETDTQPNILQRDNPYVIDLPRRKNIDIAEITARTLTGKVTLFLSGAILVVNINGSAQYEAA